MTRREAIELAFTNEVRRRRCPKCDWNLATARVRIDFSPDGSKAVVRFSCHRCGHARAGETAIDQQIIRDALAIAFDAQRAEAGPIQPDELIELHQRLDSDGWWTELTHHAS